ncbi:MAG TPA: quinone-dependent dihydroorotate dehydrogenase [Cyclobacteriaceae bacterium]|nr:quinone-dependent dihydroorotate dehydrogenase [Cyclobacteriaceae bacterium]
MYRLFIRPLLFLVDPETVHHLTFNFLKVCCAIPGVRSLLVALFSRQHAGLEKNLFGIRFSNPVGLAAGFDKDARLIDELSTLGFGFIEIGTVTPKPQSGNDKPRLFRLPADQALINRMGFNNKGAAHAAERLKERRPGVVVGGNIGKNKATPNDDAIKDYESCFETLYPYVDYFVVNVSSPNTPGLRDLQEKEPLKKLLLAMKMLSNSKPKAKPVLLKIAPDLTLTQLDDIVDILRESGTDGVIATNTTISREGLATSQDAVARIGAGGLSGKPVRERSTEVIAYLRAKLGPGYPIIGVGGIMKPEDAVEKLKAGADLVQVYTGFIYEGPSFVKRALQEITRMK